MAEVNQGLMYIFVGMALGGILFFFIARLFRRRVPVIQSSGEAFSEQEVESFLNRSGYEILSKKQRESVITNIDGKDHFGYLEADYVVRKGKKRFVLVIQSGHSAADPHEPMLRRKLLEYDHVFSPDGLLVLDLSRGELHRVVFRFPYERNIDFFFRFLIAGFIILSVIGIIWMLAFLRLI